MNQKEVDGLIKAFYDAQQKIVEIIALKEAKGNVTAFYESILKQINAELDKLVKVAKEFSSKVIEEAYMEAWQEATAVLEKYLYEQNEYFDSSFSTLHLDAIRILADNTYNKLYEVTTAVGRQIQDHIRQSSMDIMVNKFITGATVRDAKKDLIHRMLDDGLGGIKDKRGRTISLPAYADVVARAVTAEVQNTAVLNRTQELGQDLVKITQHNSPCSICAPYEGRVYSITGKDNRFPKLDNVPGFRDGYNNIHPRCRHRARVYIPELAEDLRGDIQKSNRSFDKDPRSEKEIDSYNKEQKAKTQMRNDRYQWQRYRMLLGKDAPKTFSAFRRMKNANSERFQELQSEYKSIMIKEGKKNE